MKKQKTAYVDGFVLVVPKAKLNEYKKMAKDGAKVWMKHGALSYRECVIEDGKPPQVILPFSKLVKAKENEDIWFSYIEYKSRSHRDKVNKLVMAEMEKSKDKYKDFEMPFDMKRMAYAGFKVVVNG